MNDEIKKLFEKQTHWQRDRRLLSWSEKIHLAEQMKESLIHWSKSGLKKDAPVPGSKSVGLRPS
ncbi:MAG: hypothetical protein ACKVQC_09640 [Elusimicrobiota bacterium]